jgi:Putative death-receptor fusion protein (DUF2428)
LLLKDERLTQEERVHQVNQCAQVVYQILIRCRHKGAIEAAGDAMGLLCRKLFASREEAIRNIPGKILTNFLQRLENSKLGASITRRSAGLAFLVSKIVSSQAEKSSPVSYRPYIFEIKPNNILLTFLAGFVTRSGNQKVD